MVLVVFFELNAAAVLLAFPVLGFLASAMIAVPILLWRRRPRQALACILGVSAVLATLFGLPAVGAAAQTFWFRVHLPRYERMIDEARAKRPASPVRLVLEWRDLSLFVTATLIEVVVYDETDGVRTDPCPVLDRKSCPVAPGGHVKAGSMDLSVEPIEGHFYRVTES
ncbi:hypothetical protein FHT36_001141 [Xanthobacter sp. SG618]|uniref:hypothetical protein n=1 Tax=Xanthobacter sp. SG618 TaxID=2587121 RepID=UPI00145EEE98|nr:hypothetical protein [Xanthobacter sp. SG618]NMN57244.1 hypothetical protein [Xanthobacter sp. SG618]